MSSRRKPATLDYRTPTQLSMLEKFAPFRWLFWPVGLAIFAFTFVAVGGWAVAVYELIVHLPVLAAWLAAAWGWGSLCTKRRPGVAGTATTGRCFVHVTAIALGLGLISLVTLGLGLAGAMNRPVAIGLVLVGLAIAVVNLIRHKPQWSRHVDFVHSPWLLVVPAMTITLLCALLPAGLLWGMDEPNGYDVVSYHLQVPREWYEAGHITGLHHNVYSFFPFNVEMHYLLAMHLMGGPWTGQFLAQLMHAAYMGLFVTAVYGVASQWGRARGMIAALLAAAPPWIPMLGSIAYNEAGLLLYGTLAIGWTLSPSPGTPGEGGVRVLPRDEVTSPDEKNPHPTLSRSTGRGTYALSGVLAGLAAGCKLTAVPILLVGLPIAVVIANWRQWKGAAIFVVAGLLTFSPWLIRNAVWTGNPVFPELQSALGRGHFSEEQSARWHRAHKPRPDQQAFGVRVAELGRQVFADWRFAYAVVPLGVVAMLIAVRRRESRVLLILLLILTGFWLLQTHLQGRFYVLAIPLAAIAIALLPRPILRVAAIAAPLILLYGTGASAVRLSEIQDTFSRQGADLMSAAGSTAIDSAAGIAEDTQLPIVLVGDAKAFFYQLPMSRLHYRTVFDVDTSGGSVTEAWTAGVSPGREIMLWVDMGELARFQKTYGLPLPESELLHRMTVPGTPIPYVVKGR